MRYPWLLVALAVACAPADETDAAVGDAGAADDPGCLGAVVTVGDVEVFAYEASRAAPDDPRACSVAGVLPWVDVTLGQARAACEASGFSLCDGATWQRICAGETRRGFPYGASHRPSLCNDHVSGSSALEPTGNRPDCKTPEGVYDLSGNVWELTNDAERRGASFRINAVLYHKDAARCDQPVVVPEEYATDDLGFRCCR